MWVWVKIIHLPGFHFGYPFLTHSHVTLRRIAPGLLFGQDERGFVCYLPFLVFSPLFEDSRSQLLGSKIGAPNGLVR